MDPIDTTAAAQPAALDVGSLGPAARAELRKDNVAEAFRLRQENPTWAIADIARRLGRSPSTVRGYFHDPTAEKAHKRKASYRGECQRCGRETSGGDGPGRAKELCAGCAKRRWTRDSVAAVLRAWQRDHDVRPSTYDLNPTIARRRGGDALARYEQYGLAMSRVRALFPGGMPEALAYAFGDHPATSARADEARVADPGREHAGGLYAITPGGTPDGPAEREDLDEVLQAA